MKVLTLTLALDNVLALSPQALALALALREKSWPFEGQDFLQDSGHMVVVYALNTLTVSQDSLVWKCFTNLHVNNCKIVCEVRAAV